MEHDKMDQRFFLYKYTLNKTIEKHGWKWNAFRRKKQNINCLLQIIRGFRKIQNKK